ncbi:hypothetical protein J0X19_22605 [Hymenobacter sp. BT186]|uniref:Lipoprotein n=1 Tax=Hymenobacter telluris TaxID=2816474 RepID=A0A939F0U3_9BACT|nr:hypothetical protein [Hymenobacter telluris]MBO0360769.1 hypothetical protein [Hymenobacter telluris]MBW3376797.1 hypothetical protein [Hymenobacter norwichensis]
MKKTLFSLLVVVSASTLAGCQQTQPAASSSAAEGVAPTVPTGAPTETAARTAVAAYVQQQPNAALFQLDSARFMDLDTHWQVMVPRTDWAKRMPNAAAFEVDKQTGRVTALMVK